MDAQSLYGFRKPGPRRLIAWDIPTVMSVS